ncbi:MAG: hypothetical protein WC295_06275 [Methanoregula sp.]
MTDYRIEIFAPSEGIKDRNPPVRRDVGKCFVVGKYQRQGFSPAGIRYLAAGYAIGAPCSGNIQLYGFFRVVFFLFDTCSIHMD